MPGWAVTYLVNSVVDPHWCPCGSGFRYRIFCQCGSGYRSRVLNDQNWKKFTAEKKFDSIFFTLLFPRPP
jgi:hypothetical protein